MSTHEKEKESIDMMMIPRRNNEFDLFDQMFRDPFFAEHESKVMKTDIKETKDSFLIDIDLPGYEKENIKIDVEDGYLTVQASTDSNKEEKEDGKFVRRERYTGSCSRSFYVGEQVTYDKVNATFKNGILKLVVPKIDEKEAIPEKKYVQIGD